MLPAWMPLPLLFEAGIIAQFVKLEDEQAGMVAQEVAADKGAEQGIDDQEGAAQVQAAQAAAQAAQGREALQRFAQPGQHTQGGLRFFVFISIASRVQKIQLFVYFYFIRYIS